MAKKSSRFSDYLPFLSYDPSAGLYQNSDGTVGRMWECTPASAMTETVLRSAEALLRLRLPDLSIVQFISFADCELGDRLEEFVRARKSEDPLSRAMTTELVESVKARAFGVGAGLAADVPRVRRQRLLVAVKLPIGALSADAIEDEMLNVAECLVALGLRPKSVEPEAFLQIIYSLMYGLRFSGHVSTSEELRRQAVPHDMKITIEKGHVRAGDRYLACMTPKSFPREVSYFQTDELFGDRVNLDGGCSDSYFYTFNIVFEDLRKKISTRANLALASGGEASRYLATSARRRIDEAIWCIEALENGERFARIIPLIWHWGGTEAELETSMARTRRHWEHAGYILQIDRGILGPLLISALPFGLRSDKKTIDFLERHFFVPASTVKHLLPICGDFQSEIATGSLFHTRRGQPFWIDPFRSPTNSNAIITGGAGSGFPVLQSYFAASAYAEGKTVRMITSFGGFEKAEMLYDAERFDVAADGVCMNPFTATIDIDADLAVLAAIVGQMVAGARGIEDIPESDISLVRAAIMKAYRRKEAKATITTVKESLCEMAAGMPDPVAAEAANMVASSLAEYCSGGVYGKYFEGVSNIDSPSKRMAIFDLEQFRPMPRMQSIAFLICLNEASREMMRSDTRTILLVPYIWQQIKDSHAFEAVLSTAYRRALWRGSSICFSTNSLRDFEAIGRVGEVILLNSAFKFLLQSPDFDRGQQKMLLDFDDYELAMLRTLRTRRPNYSEFLFITPWGKGVGRCILDGFTLKALSETPESMCQLKKNLQCGYGVVDAVRKLE